VKDKKKDTLCERLILLLNVPAGEFSVWVCQVSGFFHQCHYDFLCLNYRLL